MSKRNALAALAAIFSLAACSGGGNDQQSAAADTTQAATPPATPAAAWGEQSPDAGGQIITVEMLTDDQGNNVFRPADVTARKGDVVRYKLVSGVHNVHFVADSNPNLRGLPATPSDMLQLQGQTVDVKVAASPGKYYYQCDPHALLGMKGYLTVQ
jgi:plastocyanin